MSDAPDATPPDPQPTDMGPEPLPDTARDVQRDALALARSDARLNIAIAIGMAAATAFTVFGMFFARGRSVPRESNYSLIIQFAVIDVVAIVAAIRSGQRYRQIRAAVATDTVAPDEDLVPAPQPPQKHLFMIGSRPIILILVLASLGFQWQSRRRVTTGPIVFRNASITTSTGFVEEGMTVAVADGRIVFVGHSDDAIPAYLASARRIDELTSLV